MIQNIPLINVVPLLGVTVEHLANNWKGNSVCYMYSLHVKH